MERFSDLTDFAITKVNVTYDTITLKRWKDRDPQVVPDSFLQKKGPGISNGYGFGEWCAEAYYIRNGYKVISDFNLVAKHSKFWENNKVIRDLIGEQRVKEFGETARRLIDNGIKVVSHLDLFVYNDHECFFAEVKKGRDFLSIEQARFFELSKTILNVECFLVQLSPNLLELDTLIDA